MANDNPLLALAAIISSGAETLNNAYSKRGLSFPSLNEPFSPGPLDDDQGLADTTRLIVAAAHQIIATVRSPMETIQDYCPAMYMSSSLRFVEETHIADVLKDAPQGMHVDDIGAKADVDGVKIARILRYLASRHVFKEVTPNVFANNRVSSVLVKAYPLEELKANSLTRYEGAPAAAFVGHVYVVAGLSRRLTLTHSRTDEAFKSSGHLSSHSTESKDYDAPFNAAYNTQASLWKWYEEPDNEWRGRRFATAIKGGGDRFPASIFVDSLNWKALKPESVVVDVGGNVGSVTLTLAAAFPHLKYVVQDLKPVIENNAQKASAPCFWEDEAPELVSSGRVTLQAQDFFQPQSVKQADVYFLRLVIHDWPDSTSEIILKNLRAVAAPHTKLVIYEMIMPHACPDDSGSPPPPFPLLANLGLPLGGFLTMVDLQMMTLFNGQERTFTQFVELGARAGWTFEHVKPGLLSAFIFTAA
ncbi:S-adenosyl-L-methionine-dependent methyltransferase [Auriscalpium vulgare]|uniref:S-adenosyl-L-methionine-dependent methyltransferase n=1 Tax=Auriscalpium vulgare TaxID=40419 RepID=A0ACB8RNT1_9AGAM|nr:S-adenosyl-L-methionine-dependent methyltransferase [Auriscalpium vulgare]